MRKDDSSEPRRSSRLNPVKDGERSLKQLVKNRKKPQVRDKNTSSVSLLAEAMGSNLQESLPGREAELELIESSLRHSLSGGPTENLYLTGPPGTGKTSAVCLAIGRLHVPTTMYMGTCVGQRGTAVVAAFLTGLGHSTREANAVQRIYHAMGPEEAASRLRSRNEDTPRVIVLDELDALTGRGSACSRARDLFAFCSLAGIVMVGIANSVGHGGQDLLATTVVFPAYDTNTLLKIVESRAAGVCSAPSYDKKALELCVRRVGSQFGDCRMTLDAVRRLFLSTGGESSDAVAASGVGVYEFSYQVLSAMFINEDSRCGGLLKNAPLQQQMMACSAVHVARRRARLVVTYDEWRHELQNMVKFTGIKADLGLFDSHVTQMESNGFLQRHHAKGGMEIVLNVNADTFVVAAEKHSPLLADYFKREN